MEVGCAHVVSRHMGVRGGSGLLIWPLKEFIFNFFEYLHCQNKAKFLWLRFAGAVGAGCGQEGNHVTGVIHRCYGVLLAQIGRRHA